MTYEEGVAVLGLAPESDAKAARKAYLRLIKVHSPERDPEGFMRVRTAYEAVEQRLRYAPAVAPAAEPVVVSESSASPPTDPPPGAAPVVDADAEAAEAFAELEHRIWTADDPDEALELARNAVERFGTAQAYELLANKLEELGRDDEAITVMRQARAAGAIDVFVLERAAPAALSDEEVRAWSERARGDSTVTGSWTQLASELLRRGMPEEAARVVSHTVRESRKDPVAFPLLSWVAIDMALKLIEHAQPAAAQELISEQSNTPGAGVTPGVRTELVRELAHAAPELPAGAARALAIAIRSYNPVDAELDLSAYAREHRAEARAALKCLKKSAPLILQCYGPALGGPLPWKPRVAKAFAGDGSEGGGWPGFLIAMILIGVLRLVSSSYCNEPPRAKRALIVTPADQYKLIAAICVNLEDQALCESVRDLFNAADCADKGEPAARLVKEYARMRDEGTLRDRHESSLQSIVHAESVDCPGLFERSAP